MTPPLSNTIRSTPFWWEGVAFPRLGEQPVGRTCDVAIVGGGYTGLSAAIELARAGRHVQVFDRQALGQAASSRNGGMASGSIRPGRDALVRRLGEDGADRVLLEGKAAREDLQRFIREEGIDCEFALTGLFDGALTRAEADGLVRRAEFLHRKLGIEAFGVDRADVPRYIGTDLYVGGFVRKDIGGLQPAKLLAATIRIAVSAGAILHENVAVLGSSEEADGVRVRTARGDVLARTLLVCTDGYTDGFDPWLRRRLVPVRSRIIATEPLGREVMDALMPARMMYGDGRKLSYYYRPSPGGSRILFGGRDGTVEGDPEAPTAHLRAELTRLFPQLNGVGVTHSWFGYVAMNRDMIPRLFASGRTVYATGYCGSGVVWGRWLGRKAAFRILGDRDRARTVFDLGAAPKAVPLYRGRPWFIPLVYSLYGRTDRRKMRQRARTP